MVGLLILSSVTFTSSGSSTLMYYVIKSIISLKVSLEHSSPCNCIFSIAISSSVSSFGCMYLKKKSECELKIIGSNSCLRLSISLSSRIICGAGLLLAIISVSLSTIRPFIIYVFNSTCPSVSYDLSRTETNVVTILNLKFIIKQLTNLI